MPIKVGQGEEVSLNMTSLIDVVFFLNIFLLLATTFPRPEQDLEVELPKVVESAALTEAPAYRVVNVRRDGRVTLEQQEVTLEELTQTLSSARRQYEGLGVQVRGDAEAVHQRVAEVLHACQQAGIKQLGISVTTKELR
jgi:biopolymer transport protein ExbD